MARHDVVVRQLLGRDDHSRLFLNVDGEEYGHLQVWGNLYSWKHGEKKDALTFLLMDRTTFSLIVFESEEWAKEWFEVNVPRYWNKVFLLKDGQVREVEFVKEEV